MYLTWWEAQSGLDVGGQIEHHPRGSVRDHEGRESLERSFVRGEKLPVKPKKGKPSEKSPE